MMSSYDSWKLATPPYLEDEPESKPDASEWDDDDDDSPYVRRGKALYGMLSDLEELRAKTRV